MTTKILLRTECNGRSKYFHDDIQAANTHFEVCMAKRKNVELWLFNADGTQKLLDRVTFYEYH